MQELKVKCVGVTYSVEVPSTYGEYDRMAKKENACLQSGIMNGIYRSTNATFRSQFASAVEKETGIERETKVVGTKTIKGEGDQPDTEEDVIDYAETEKVYLDRVYEELDLDTEEKRLEYFADIISAIESELKFDPAERESNAKPKRARKSFRDFAESILAKKGQGVLEAVAAKLAEELDMDVEATTESVALAIQEKDDRRQRAEQESLLSDI